MKIEEIESILAGAHHRLKAQDLMGATEEDLLAVAQRPHDDLRGRALDELIRRRSSTILNILREDLKNPKLPPHIRAQQASRLGRTGLKAVEPILIEALPRSIDELVTFKIISALARVGTEAALPALETAASSGVSAISRIAEFAHSVVSHRLGRVPRRTPLDGAPPRITLKGIATAIASQPVPHARVQSLVDELAGDLYGLGPAAGPAFELSCPAGRWIVILNRDLSSLAPATLLTTRPLLLGIVVVYFAEDDSWASSRVLLAGPTTARQAYVGVYRQDGALTQVGSGEPSADSLTIDIASVQIPGNFALSARAYTHGTHLAFSGFAATTKLAGGRPTEIAPRK
jgi:hypothetical protein